jgi:Amt family ammonium transporter
LLSFFSRLREALVPQLKVHFLVIMLEAPAWENCLDGLPDTGDTAWMLFATTFVMLQTPATGICQAGLVRRKNCVSVLAQTMLGVAIGAVLWFFIGFSLTFGPSVNGFIGNFEYCMLLKIEARDCFPNAPTIPAIMFVSYQMMFALMVPVLVTGAWAERMHFRSFVIFTVVWPFLVYYPVAHAFWNKDGIFSKWGVLDFAGGLVIHATSGVAALVVAIMLEKRRHHKKLAQQGTVHNIPLMVIGGALVWAGWYSFNGGSALAANFQAVNALMATQMSASVGAITWAILSAITLGGKVPSANIVSGALAGLAGITAASGFISPASAVCAGMLAGISSFFSARFIRTKLYIDDVLDVTALQAVPGISGAIVVAFAANPEYIPGAIRESRHEGLFIGGSPILLGKQICAVLATCAWTAVATWALFVTMRKTVGINITPEEEEKGLDQVDHGETAYDDDTGFTTQVDQDSLGSRMCEAAARGEITELAMLIRSGGNPLGTDYEGMTPMHSAASAGQESVMAWLHHVHGISLDVKDAFGTLPIECALKARQENSIAWLQARGAVVPECDIAELLCNAAATNDTTFIAKLLATVASDVNLKDYDGRTPLHIASIHGYDEAVAVLLSFGADSTIRDNNGSTPQEDARRGGFDKVVTLLKQSVNSNNSSQPRSTIVSDEGRLQNNSAFPVERRHSSSRFSPLLTSRSQSMLIPLIPQTQSLFDSHSENNDTSTPILTATSSSTQLRASVSTSALCACAASGDLSELKRLIRKGANPNIGDYNNRTPLHIAASNGHVGIVKYLCRLRGINVNSQDRFQSTPLMDALAKDNSEICQVLRAHGATAINTAHGYRLCRAAAEGNIELLEQMALMGTNLNSTDYDGRTAMHLAASTNRVHVAQWLIGWGADVTVCDRWGRTPLQDARHNGHAEVMEILRKAGASEVTNESDTKQIARSNK